MKYKFHIDPGHGWVEVPFEELVQLGISDKISTFSYRSVDTCYLEEDCDATRWFEAYKQQHGKHPEHENVYHKNDCFVRNLRRFFL